MSSRSDSACSSPTMSATPVTPVAVIGMACRLPGGIDSPEQLWEALLRGDDLVTEVPPDRWDADDYYDPEPGVPGRSVSKWGGFLDDVAPRGRGIRRGLSTQPGRTDESRNKDPTRHAGTPRLAHARRHNGTVLVPKTAEKQQSPLMARNPPNESLLK